MLAFPGAILIFPKICFVNILDGLICMPVPDKTLRFNCCLVKIAEGNIFDPAPERGVNKTIEVIAPATTLGDYIIIGQLLQTLPATFEGNLFTRPFLQDSCYCKYGWTVSESNKAIDLCVEKGLFKLV